MQLPPTLLHELTADGPPRRPVADTAPSLVTTPRWPPIAALLAVGRGGRRRRRRSRSRFPSPAVAAAALCAVRCDESAGASGSEA
jgi:hypothetical protein